MRIGVTWAARTAVLLGLLAGCATQPPVAAETAAATADTATTGAECRPSRKSRFREMTWSEYYADVRERAWRNSAQIIWITPPKLRKPRPFATPGAAVCAR